MTLDNRLVMTPMGTNFGEQNGEMSFLHMDYYERRAKGGYGLLIVENACVKYPEGSNGTTQLRIDADNYIPRLYKLCETIHQYGTKIAIQLNHAGASAMESRIGMQPVSASAVANKEGGAIPRALTVEEIYSIADDYAMAAKRAQTIGFDAVEIHAGHSYLISQFLSPLTNKRTDEFGGSYENRARFARIIVEKVRKAVGTQFPIIIRISADEFLEGGNTLKDSIELLKYFEQEVDMIDVSAGLSDSIHKQIDANYYPDGWRSYMASEVKKAFPHQVVMTTGNIRNPKVAVDILEKQDADLIGMGRQTIADPSWPHKVKIGQIQEIRQCISCNIGCAGHRIGLNRPIRCTVNPDVFYDDAYKKLKVNKPTNVVVIGGGTAGLEAACTASEVGCTTFLIEKEKELGGLARQISQIPEKYRVAHFPKYLEHRAKKLHDLFILKGVEATSEFVDNFKPDIIVVATGSKPLLPPIQGLKENIDLENNKVSSIDKFMNHLDLYPQDATNKEIVIVGGGAVGLDVAEYFANRGASPTIIEMMDQIGRDLDPVTKSQTKEMMEKHHVTQMTSTKLKEVHEDYFIVEKDGKESKIPFDYGFICLGMKAYNPLYQQLKDYYQEENVDILEIGDCKRARRIIEGTQEARNIIHLLKQKELL